MVCLFDNISPKNKEKILKLIEAMPVNYNKDIDILSGINRKNFLAFIEEGSVQIELNDYLGNNIILDNLSKNEVFGSLLNSINSDECSIITKEKSKIILIDTDNINNSDIVKNESYIIFIRNLLHIMTTQLNNKNERIQILTKRTIRDKLLEYFKILSKNKGSRIFELPYSFTDLSNYLCVDRSAMTREISHLKQEGFIKINNRQVTLKY